MKLQFLYSKTREKERLLNIYKEYQWFIDNNFPIILPKFYKKLYQEKKSHLRLFKKALVVELKRIYIEEVYKQKIEIIKNNWQLIDEDFFKILKKLNLKSKNKYHCYISLYGSAGQFQCPNIINLRIAEKNDIQEANITIVHEIIHLLIFNKAKRLKLSYKQIEGVVDLFFKKTDLQRLFPKYKLQRGVIHNEKLFNQLVK